MSDQDILNLAAAVERSIGDLVLQLLHVQYTIAKEKHEDGVGTPLKECQSLEDAVGNRIPGEIEGDTFKRLSLGQISGELIKQVFSSARAQTKTACVEFFNQGL